MTRIVRHQSKRVTAAPLVRHVAYLKRGGVTRDGEDARMFDAASDIADAKAFAERCEGDRHHFRFTVSPEGATQMVDLYVCVHARTHGQRRARSRNKPD